MRFKFLLSCVVIFSFAPSSSSAKAADEDTVESESARKGIITRKPEVLTKVQATYPPKLFLKGVTGAVVLRITIDAAGDVTEATIEKTSGYPELDTSAVEALYQFKFSPAFVDEKPAAVQVQYRYAFTIERQVIETAVKQTSAAPPTGRLSGTILRKGSRSPIPGILVRIPKLALESITDERGRFSFETVPTGKVIIQLDDDDHYQLEDEETIETGKETDVRYYLEPTGLSENQVTVVGRKLKKEVAKRTLTVQEIRKIPGANGDALKVIENLPGVARIPFGLGGLVVRGSNFGDSAATLDRHFIPIPFHFGGLRSVIASEMIESIDFYPGNFGAEHGRFSGGLIDVRLRRPRGDRYSGRIEADVFDTGVFLEGPITDKLTFAIGARRSYIDVLLGSALSGIDDLSFQTVPRYYDYQAILDYRSGGHQLRTFLIGSDDAMVLVLNEPVAGNAGLRGALENEIRFFRGYMSWKWRASDFFSNDLSVALGRNTLLLNFGSDIRVDNLAWQLTVREDIKLRFSEKVTLRAGFDYDGFFGTLDLKLPLPPKEGGGAARGRSLASVEFIESRHDFLLRNPAAWTELQIKLFEKNLLLVPGIRAEYDLLIDDYIVDPRLTTRLTLVKDKTTLKAGVGLFSQRPSPDESDEEFGDPNIRFERALHTSAGIEQALGERFELDVVGFYKYLYDMVRPVEQADVQGALDGDVERRLENTGIGRVYGLEVLLRHVATEQFFGWVSYTLMRSERRDPGTSTYRPFDFDQTHVLTILGQYKLTNSWEIGARFRYSTGRPQTPFDGSVYNSDADSYEGIPGEVNSVRIPSFHQLDLRIDRNWLFDTWTLSAYFEIRNVYNRANPERLDVNFDFTSAKFSSGLPIIPSLGIRGQF